MDGLHQLSSGVANDFRKHGIQAFLLMGFYLELAASSSSSHK